MVHFRIPRQFTIMYRTKKIRGRVRFAPPVQKNAVVAADVSTDKKPIGSKKVTAVDRIALFEQASLLVRFLLVSSTGIRVRIHDITGKAAKYREIVAVHLVRLNQRRHVRGKPVIDVDIPSHIGMIPMLWNDVVEFVDGGPILNIAHVVQCAFDVVDAIQKVHRTYRAVQFCLVDCARIEMKEMLVFGVQIFFAVPLSPDMAVSDMGKMYALEVSNATKLLAQAYVDAFNNASDSDSSSKSDGEPSCE